jgi:uncharacterized SAM-binding protein YcdF (DUF218 family)
MVHCSVVTLRACDTCCRPVECRTQRFCCLYFCFAIGSAQVVYVVPVFALDWVGTERFCRACFRLAIGSAPIVHVVVFALRLGVRQVTLSMHELIQLMVVLEYDHLYRYIYSYSYVYKDVPSVFIHFGIRLYRLCCALALPALCGRSSCA